MPGPRSAANRLTSSHSRRWHPRNSDPCAARPRRRSGVMPAAAVRAAYRTQSPMSSRTATGCGRAPAGRRCNDRSKAQAAGTETNHERHASESRDDRDGNADSARSAEVRCAALRGTASSSSSATNGHDTLLARGELKRLLDATLRIASRRPRSRQPLRRRSSRGAPREAAALVHQTRDESGRSAVPPANRSPYGRMSMTRPDAHGPTGF